MSKGTFIVVKERAANYRKQDEDLKNDWTLDMKEVGWRWKQHLQK